MKRISYFIIPLAIFLGFGFTSPYINVSEKVLDVFNKTFQNVQNVKWINIEDEYIAVFKQNEIQTIITYNKNGDFKSCRRYYTEATLPFDVLLKIKEKFMEKTIGIVTELIEGNNLIYSINLEDQEDVYVIETRSRNLRMHVKRKFQKQHS